MYRVLAKEYGWTPEQVNQLTYYQAAFLCGAVCPEDGDSYSQRQISLEDYKALVRADDPAHNQRRILKQLLGG